MRLRIGDWKVNKIDRTVGRGAQEAHLKPRSWDVLMYLADRTGQIVSTRELLDRFWRGSISDETAVRKAIVEIRRAFEDDSSNPEYIRTVPKVGYSMVAQVDRDEPVDQITVAVLPLDNLSGDPANDHLGDGLSEEIINHLTQNPSLRVVARNSSFQFKGQRLGILRIAAELQATHLVEGSIRRQDDDIRVTAQLIEGTSGAHLFSSNFDHSLENLFGFHDEVGQAVAFAVSSHLTPHQQNTNRHSAETVSEARDLFSRSKALLESEHPERMVEGIELLERCVSSEPGFVDAWLTLAVANCELCVDYIGQETPASVLPRAEAAAAKVLELVPDQPRAIGILAWCAFLLRFDWQESASLFERSTTLDPQDSWVNAAYCYYLRCLRDPNARMYGERATNSARPCNFAFWVLAIDHLFAGREAEAIRVIESAETTSFAGHVRVGLLHAFAGRFQQASQELTFVRRILPNHACARLLNYFVVQNMDITNKKRIQQTMLEVEEYSKSHYVPLLVTMAWPQSVIESIWRQAMRERQTTPPFYVLGDKPPELGDEIWRAFKQEMRSNEAEAQPIDDFLRNWSDRAELYDNQFGMSVTDMDAVVGMYQRVASTERLAVQRRREELWVIYGADGDYQLMVPVAPDRYELFSYHTTLQFGRSATGRLEIRQSARGTTTTWVAVD